MARYINKQNLLVLGICLLLCGCMQAMASDVSLAWDASTSSGIAGYKVYVGNTSGSYNSPITIGNQTTYTVTNLASGTYYFAVTAVDSSGNESGYSNEVSTTVIACDVNKDSGVNAIDLQAMINNILGVNTSTNGDLNNDGRIDVLDLQILNNVILGLRSCP
jgi:fibronectin type 3 domain-containing protein